MPTALYEAVLPDGETLRQRSTSVTDDTAFMAVLVKAGDDTLPCGIVRACDERGFPLFGDLRDEGGNQFFRSVPARRVA